MKAIINANIIMLDHVIPNGVILFENGVIKDFGKTKKVWRKILAFYELFHPKITRIFLEKSSHY